MKEYKPGWKNTEPMERVYIKYDPNNNLPTHEAIIRNHIDKEANALEISLCVTDDANQNITPSYKELLRWYFRLGHIAFQYLKMVNLHRASEGSSKFQGSG